MTTPNDKDNMTIDQESFSDVIIKRDEKKIDQEQIQHFFSHLTMMKQMMNKTESLLREVAEKKGWTLTKN